jgi:predicted PurR-regulated permease PerM
MMAAFLSLIAVVYLVIRLVVPQLWSCLEILVDGIPGAVQGVVEFIEVNQLLPENITETLHDIVWPSKIGQIVQIVTSGLGSVVDVLITTITSVFSWIVSGLLSIIFAIYLLTGKEKLGAQINRLMEHYLKSSLNLYKVVLYTPKL